MARKRHGRSSGATSDGRSPTSGGLALSTQSSLRGREPHPAAVRPGERLLAAGLVVWLLWATVYYSAAELEFLRSKIYPTLAGGAVGLGLLGYAAWRGRLVVARSTLWPFVGAWLAALGVSALASPFPAVAARVVAVQAACALAWAGSAWLARRGLGRTLQGAVALIGGVVAVIAIAQAAGFKPLEVNSASVNEVALQGASAQYVAFSTLGHKNLVASFCLMCAAAAGGLAFSARSLRDRVLWGSVTALVAGGVLVARSRTGWAVAALLVLLAVAGWAVSRLPASTRERLKRVGLVGVGLVIAGVVATIAVVALGPGSPGSLHERLTVERMWGVFNNRGVHWIVAALMVSAHPLLGVGPGHFGHAYSTHLLEALGWVADPYKGGNQANQAHSDPLHIAAETGLIGFAAHVALWGAVATLAMRVLQTQEGADRARAAGLALGVLAFHLTGLLDFPYASGPHTLVVWTLTGLLAGMASMPTGEPAAVSGRPGQSSAHDGVRSFDIPRAGRVPLALLLGALMVGGLWQVSQLRAADRHTVEGRAAYRSGALAAAKPLLELAIGEDGTMAEAFFWRGRLAHRERDLERARTDLERSRALWPHYAVELATGLLLLESGRPAEAAQALERYLRIRPMAPPRDYQLLVRALRAAGEGQRAEGAEKMADPARRMEMGQQVEAEGKPGEAFNWYLSIEDDSGYLAAVRASIAAGEPERGRAVLGRIRDRKIRGEGERLLAGAGAR